MASLNDLRHILGQWMDLNTADLINGTAGDDTINIYGGNDYVHAQAGNDLIFDVRSYSGGNSGNDTVLGGDGNDMIVSSLDSTNVYSGDLGNDTINLIPNNHGVYVDLDLGIARDRSTLATSTLISIENATGSAWTDYLYGSAVANTLNGYNGDDLIRGQGGRDLLYGGRDQDVLFGGSEADSVHGEDGNDMLYGDSGNDQLFGGAGTDYLIGGTGKDYLAGGASADTFRFTALNQSGLTGGTADMISDFQHLVDKIDVRDIDANALAGGNQAFRFIGTAGFSAAGQVRYVFDAASQDTIVMFNTDNDAAAEMVIKIDPRVTLTSIDFVL